MDPFRYLFFFFCCSSCSVPGPRLRLPVDASLRKSWYASLWYFTTTYLRNHGDNTYSKLKLQPNRVELQKATRHGFRFPTFGGCPNHNFHHPLTTVLRFCEDDTLNFIGITCISWLGFSSSSSRWSALSTTPIQNYASKLLLPCRADPKE